MKRRNFVQSLLVVPASAIADPIAQQPPPQTSAPPPAAPPPALRGPQEVPKLALSPPDAVAATRTGYFTPPQYSTLTKLAATLIPPLKERPGAIAAHAPEFLDFLISCSPEPDRHLYRDGLDGLDAAAHKRYNKPFAELDAPQVDAIIRPLLVVRAWEREELPDPMTRFMARVYDDLRTATMNSAEWAASGASTGRTRFNSGRRYYWKPIDPLTGV